jgi:hypothetical protein
LKYEPGDKVLLDVRMVPQGKCKKFMPRYTGPFRVVRTYENGTIDIAGGGVIKRVNMQRIKPLFETHVWGDQVGPPYSLNSLDEKEESMEESTEDFNNDEEQNVVYNNRSSGDERIAQPDAMESTDSGSNEAHFPQDASIEKVEIERLHDDHTDSNQTNFNRPLRDRRTIKKPNWQAEYDLD